VKEAINNDLESLRSARSAVFVGLAKQVGAVKTTQESDT